MLPNPSIAVEITAFLRHDYGMMPLPTACPYLLIASTCSQNILFIALTDSLTIMSPASGTTIQLAGALPYPVVPERRLGR